MSIVHFNQLYSHEEKQRHRLPYHRLMVKYTAGMGKCLSQICADSSLRSSVVEAYIWEYGSFVKSLIHLWTGGML
jgi:hypothetical protein